MQKQKKYTSAEVKTAEEQFIIQSYLDFNSDWVLFEYPIQSIRECQLQSGDSIPDGIVINQRTKKRRWIEVTSVSRFLNDRKKIGLQRKGILDEAGKLQGPINLNRGEFSLKENVSNIIIQKNEKTYEKFANLAGLDPNGILVIHLDMRDPFHDENEHLNICEYFRDEHILFSLGSDNSSFSNVFLLSNVMLENGVWIPKLSSVADAKMMIYLKKRQLFKEGKIADFPAYSSN